MSITGYKAKLTPTEIGSFAVSFDAVPEALTEISSLSEFEEVATDCLITALDFYIESRRVFPLPEKVTLEDHAVRLPVSIMAKILLLNTMASLNIRPADLARKMKITPQEVNRIIDTHHTTKIDTIAKALQALDKDLSVSI